MREPNAEGENEDARRGQERQRPTPLLARQTPSLGVGALMESDEGEGWCPPSPPSAEWSGPLPVPPRQRTQGSIIGQRIASIESVPYELLGWADRWFLLYWARKGYPVYAYCAPSGRWNLWLDYWRVELPLPAHLRLLSPGEQPEDDEL